MITAVLYLLASLCGGLASHWAYTKLLLKHTSWTTTERFPSRPYGDLEMQSGREHPAPGEAGTPAAKLRAGGQPDFEAIPAIERMAVRFPHLLIILILLPLLLLPLILLLRLSARRVLRLQLVFLYAIASAAVGTQSVVMAKCTSQILRLQIGGESQLGSPFSVYILLVFAGSASFWMMRLNRGLRLFPSTFIVPMMQAMWTVLSILNGGIFFAEFENFDARRSSVFLLAVLIVLGSVLSLAAGKADDGGGGGEEQGERDSLLGRQRSGSGAG